MRCRQSVTAWNLLVSTATTGNHPDDDGYLLTVDDDHSTFLEPTDTVSLEVPSGRHALSLVGVAEHCHVTPELPLEIEIESSGTTPVTFDVDCQSTGALVTVTTTGLDLDPDGYRLVVDGVDRQFAPANGTTVALLGAGRHTLMLQGFADNCTREGPVSQTVTVSGTQLVPVTFAAICRAKTGVIQVSLAPGDVEGAHEVRLDGTGALSLVPGQFVHFARVAPGDHVVSLTSPDHCQADQAELPATVTAGGVTRDTVAVVFPVVCEPTRLLITAPTAGQAPNLPYAAWGCATGSYFCYYYGYDYFGPVPPNDALLVLAEPGVSYDVELRDLPGGCRVTGSNPAQSPAVQAGDTVVVEFPVACSP
jgi:hypothetical protein